jgi:hypothetical protein
MATASHARTYKKRSLCPCCKFRASTEDELTSHMQSMHLCPHCGMLVSCDDPVKRQLHIEAHLVTVSSREGSTDQFRLHGDGDDRGGQAMGDDGNRDLEPPPPPPPANLETLHPLPDSFRVPELEEMDEQRTVTAAVASGVDDDEEPSPPKRMRKKRKRPCEQSSTHFSNPSPSLPKRRIL